VEARPIILVEGIVVLADPTLRACFDASVFVSAPRDIRLIRRIERDKRDRGRTEDEVIAQYLATVRPMHERFVEPTRTFADLTLDGMLPVGHCVDVLVAFLEQRAP